MSRLKVGVIGYGGRISDIAKGLTELGIPQYVAAIADPLAEEKKKKDDPRLKEAQFFTDADTMLKSMKLDGVMIGTRCNLHTEMACKVAKYNLPLFLEKPVSINFDQVRQLEAAFRNVTAPVVVSFPLRLSPICLRAKEIIDSGALGPIDHVVAFNDVPYGDCYWAYGYRDYEVTGGLWLQKATHDLDYLNFLLGQKPKWVCGMMSNRVYGGDKPMDLLCRDCDERETCRESPAQLFRKSFVGDKVEYDQWRYCVFGKDIKNEDSGNCILEYENGVQAAYSQNFFIKHKAARRGARFYGYKGTLEFDWYQNHLKVYRHDSPVVETHDFTGDSAHFGGDHELIYDFLMGMRDGKPSRAPLEAGILSALTCLYARQSCETRQFCEIRMPS
jgi:predicted dehydrogenase